MADKKKDKEEKEKGDEPKLPEYFIPPGGWPIAKEELRPTRNLFIKGDPDLPSYYNTRLAFPKCQPMILDQQICGSCWAFSSAGHLEDRFCIHSDAQIKVTLSPQDMINCSFESFGCKGGYLSQAIDFLESEGTSTYQCLPYENHKNACFLGCKDPKMAY